MTPKELEQDAVALEMLVTLRVARGLLQRAVDDGVLAEPLWVTPERSLLDCIGAAIEHGMHVFNPLTPPGAPRAALPAGGGADAWRAAFEDTVP